MSASLIRKARLLATFTIVYNLVEALVSMYFGATEESLALFGFGLDALIECLSAGLVLWRFQKETHSESEIGRERERKATKGIGILFLVLATSVFLGSLLALWKHQTPETTLPGLIISLASLSFMFYLYRAKLNVGRSLGSRVIVQDAKCSLACIQLSAILFFGSLLFMLHPVLWWVDSVAALGLAGLIAREGWESFHNDGCCSCD